MPYFADMKHSIIKILLLWNLCVYDETWMCWTRKQQLDTLKVFQYKYPNIKEEVRVIAYTIINNGYWIRGYFVIGNFRCQFELPT